MFNIDLSIDQKRRALSRFFAETYEEVMFLAHAPEPIIENIWKGCQNVIRNAVVDSY